VEANVYYRNVIDAVRPENYGFMVECQVGKNESRRWTYLPKAEDAGKSFDMKLALVSDREAETTTVLRVVVAPAPVVSSPTTGCYLPLSANGTIRS
jgi:hypothetical protein